MISVLILGVGILISTFLMMWGYNVSVTALLMEENKNRIRLQLFALVLAAVAFLVHSLAIIFVIGG